MTSIVSKVISRIQYSYNGILKEKRKCEITVSMGSAPSAYKMPNNSSAHIKSTDTTVPGNIGLRDRDRPPSYEHKRNIMKNHRIVHSCSEDVDYNRPANNENEHETSDVTTPKSSAKSVKPGGEGFRCSRCHLPSGETRQKGYKALSARSQGDWHNLCNHEHAVRDIKLNFP